MKGVILAGGRGSRLKPLTTIVNKHLLPIGPYPMIYWSIFRLKEAGISDIVIITNKKDLGDFLTLLGHGEDFNVSLNYKIQQNEGGGIADALNCAKDILKTDKFIVLLGDNIFQQSLTPFVNDYNNQEKGARVLLKEVEDPTRYGVPIIDHTNKKILSIIEKPQIPPTNFCVTGIYMYNPDVFQYIEKLQPSERNELEITDVNNLYVKESELQYDILPGWWIDAGTHKSLYQAFQYVYGEDFKEEGN